jgi:extracellular elastinolytic metalloproteinase
VVARRGRDYPSREPPARLAAALARSEDSPALMLPAAYGRALPRALAVAVVAAGLAAAPTWAMKPERENFDGRPAGSSRPPAGAARARERIRERLGRFAALSLDPRTNTLRSVGRLDGFLTEPTKREGAVVALDYVSDHATAFGLDSNDLDGLRLVDRSVVDGIEHLSWEQTYRGVPVADAGLQAAVTSAGRLIAVTGPPAPDLAVRSVEPIVGAREAYSAARESAGGQARLPTVAAAEGNPERQTRFADGGRASLALYRGGAGYRLAWRVLAPISSTGVYDLLVDARTGAVVRRANRVNFAVPGSVFPYTPDTSVPAGQISVDFAPWLTSSNSLSGPNVHAFVDELDRVPFRPGSGAFHVTPESGSDVPPENGGYQFPLHIAQSHTGDGCPESFTTFPTSACTWDPRTATGTDAWPANRKQSAAQLFYLVNVFHDHLRDDPNIAFTNEAFERTPRPLGHPDEPADRTASDPVLAQALDGAAIRDGLPDLGHSNNSSFLTLPDGYPGMMQSYLWKPPFGGYDGANDASLVFHEYTHGLSNRLITDAAGFGALNTAQAGAMGEGWSDFYAMDYLEEKSLEQDDSGVADVRLGRYLDNASGALVRFQPIDCDPALPTAECPAGSTEAGPSPAGTGAYTYDDFGRIDPEGPEVHYDGEIWAQTLWSLRTDLIDAYDRDPADMNNGIARTRRYVTKAMRLSPPEPSFLDMRNALLEASPNEDDDLIWTIFAERGMGYFAGSDGSDDTTPIADFTDPKDFTQSGSISGTVFDQDGPLAGATVGIAGFDDGLGPQHKQTSGADGTYTIAGVPVTDAGNYPVVRARKAGHSEDREPDVEVGPGQATPIDFHLVRDWSSSAPATGRAAVTRFTGDDNTSSGCGPGGLIDDDPATVWGTERDDGGGQEIVVELGAPVDVGTIALDPSAGCGDDDTAALGAYEVLGASTSSGEFRSLAAGVFDAPNLGQLNDVFTGSSLGVRYVMLRAKGPQSAATGTSGENFIDVAEMHVARVAGSPIGAAADTGSAQGVGPAGATLTGSVVPHGPPAQVIFEYGTTTAYGSAVGAGNTPAGEGATPVAAAVGGLQPSTTYHFRVVALRDGRRYEGGDATFVTGASPQSPPPASPAPPPPVAKVTSLVDSKLKANRRGFFKVKAHFGDTAPPGRARFTLRSRKGKRLARATTPVRQGRTLTKTLRLNKKGRKMIKPGRSKKVVLELRLPGGDKFKKSLRLARGRR